MNNKPIYVTFINKKLEGEFESLNEGKFQDKKLFEFMDRAIKDLKKDPTSGTKIQKRIWPKTYVKKQGINNLWKYDLPNGWRIIYTIKTDEVMILNVILEWFTHKEYERRFKYQFFFPPLLSLKTNPQLNLTLSIRIRLNLSNRKRQVQEFAILCCKISIFCAQRHLTVSPKVNEF